ncbi:hypothetical protein FH972_019474 [Carpinus fangiana]|uniref:Secreted protein n=1 Tax=Carpinus fangiana TaxID=176857 RepID=A0A5N6RQ87_9ROSI|nr:hypothetical protein FH972_019474 [Carpinus fangiana]
MKGQRTTWKLGVLELLFCFCFYRLGSEVDVCLELGRKKMVFTIDQRRRIGFKNPRGSSRRGSGGRRPWVSGRDPRLGQTCLDLTMGWPARGRSDETEKEGTMRERRTMTE